MSASLPAVTILDALDHPAVFAPIFAGSTWGPSRAFLGALFGLPLSGEALALYQHHHTERQAAPVAPFREAALVVGRRGGKSRILALIATYLACFRDYGPFLAPGEVVTIAVIAADRKQARSIFRFTIGLLRAIPALARLIENDRDDSIVLSNRVVIEIHTARFKITIGYIFAAVLADETAFWRDESFANPDSEIFRALRPGLSTIPGAMPLNDSSPYRKSSVLYSSFRRHFGKENARVLYKRASRLFGELTQARGEGRLPRLLATLERVRLLIIDDWGPETFNAEQRRDLLEIVDDRYAWPRADGA